MTPVDSASSSGSKGRAAMVPKRVPRRSLLQLAARAKPSKVRIYRNGDEYFPGRMVCVPRSSSLDAFLDRVGEEVKPVFGTVYRLYTTDGKRVTDLKELEDGAGYVAAGRHRFRRLDYLGIEAMARLQYGKPISDDVSSHSMWATSASASSALFHAVTVTVYCNGEEFEPRRMFRLNKHELLTFPHLLQLFSDKMQLRTGPVNYLYSLDGYPVTTLKEIVNGSKLVASTHPKYVELDYSAIVDHLPPFRFDLTEIHVSAFLGSETKSSTDDSRVQVPMPVAKIRPPSPRLPPLNTSSGESTKASINPEPVQHQQQQQQQRRRRRRKGSRKQTADGEVQEEEERHAPLQRDGDPEKLLHDAEGPDGLVELQQPLDDSPPPSPHPDRRASPTFQPQRSDSSLHSRPTSGGVNDSGMETAESTTALTSSYDAGAGAGPTFNAEQPPSRCRTPGGSPLPRITSPSPNEPAGTKAEGLPRISLPPVNGGGGNNGHANPQPDAAAVDPGSADNSTSNNANAALPPVKIIVQPPSRPAGSNDPLFDGQPAPEHDNQTQPPHHQSQNQQQRDPDAGLQRKVVSGTIHEEAGDGDEDGGGEDTPGPSSEADDEGFDFDEGDDDEETEEAAGAGSVPGARRRRRRPKPNGTNKTPTERRQAAAKQPVKRIKVTLENMHETVVSIAAKAKVKLVKVSDFKYRIAGTKKILFLRLLSGTIMVRVGGGWAEFISWLHQHAKERKALTRQLRPVESIIQEATPEEISDAIRATHPLSKASNVIEGHHLNQGSLEVNMKNRNPDGSPMGSPGAIRTTATTTAAANVRI